MKIKTIYLFTAIAAAIVLTASCRKTPVACIKSDKTTAAINETITFISCSENAETTEWDFGDGSSAEGNSVTYAYSTAGTYTVKITAFSKREKKKDETSISITIITSNGGGSAPPNTWTKKADFGGEDRAYAVGFSIGSKGYIGTGDRLWNGPLKDFWEYDPATNVWTQKSDYGGGSRRYAIGFSIGTKGYLGTGDDENFSATKDFWEYDPSNNTWTKKTDFGGTARSGAVGFSIGNKGYVGTGYSNNLEKDFWEYNPATDVWLKKTDFGGTARSNSSGFPIGTKAYIVAGSNANNNYLKDCWEYDQTNDLWLQKTDLAGGVNGIERHRAFGFAIGNKGYIGTGDRITNGVQYTMLDFWEYSPASDTWALKTAFDGKAESARFGAVGFSIGNKGYAGTGVLGSTLKDFWEYTQ